MYIVKVIVEKQTIVNNILYITTNNIENYYFKMYLPLFLYFKIIYYIYPAKYLAVPPIGPFHVEPNEKYEYLNRVIKLLKTTEIL